MIPVSKGLNPRDLAHKWRIVRARSAEQSIGIMQKS